MIIHEDTEKIVERNQSLGPVRLRSDLGIDTALQLRRDEDLIRFSIQRATIDDFDRAEVWRSEVEARMALHDYGAALALAQRTELKEDRLHLLAVIAKAKREQKLQLEPELLEQMRHLYAQINPTLLQGEKAIGIAADLPMHHDVYNDQFMSLVGLTRTACENC